MMSDDTNIATPAPVRRKELAFKRVPGRTVAAQQKLEEAYNQLGSHHLSRTISTWVDQPPERFEQMVDGAIAAYALMSPRDAIEDMLVTQMMALQEATMASLAKANVPGQYPEARANHLNAANKCSRTFAALVETLNKHRGKGQQKVTVEHVHVHAGGQAIVGTVETGGSRGG